MSLATKVCLEFYRFHTVADKQSNKTFRTLLEIKCEDFLFIFFSFEVLKTQVIFRREAAQAMMGILTFKIFDSDLDLNSRENDVFLLPLTIFNR